jgi:hypothetical protein
MSTRTVALLVVALLAAGCALLPAAASPSASPGVSAAPSERIPPSSPPSTEPPQPPSEAPSSTPRPVATPGCSFYLRAWYTQAIPPIHTFTWLPPVTIADGTYINGNIAVPAIYPGPLLISPVSRSISESCVAALEDEARRLGLLSGQTDFTGGAAMPGARLGQLEIEINGQTYELTGNADATLNCTSAPCDATPGTPEAFTAFWRDLSLLDSWMPDELGPSAPYPPERIAMLLTAPQPSDGSIKPQPVDWPLDTPLAQAGSPFPGQADTACLTLSGSDLDVLLPILQSGNQLTVFVDKDGTTLAPIARVLVPGEPSPCNDGQ